jgi:esterase/lipase superfamily enzyme
MSDLHTRILALPDPEAMAVLHRLARALASGPANAHGLQNQAQKLAVSLSLPVEPATAMDPGELARSALLLLADDSRFASSIASLLDAPRGHFARDVAVVEAADLLTVLQTQVSVSDSDGAMAMPSGSTVQPGLLKVLARQLIGRMGLLPARLEVDAEYGVWYATSRRPIDAANPSQGFGGERDTRIHYGQCSVFVPRSHQVGSIGSGWWTRTVLQTDDRLKLLAVSVLAEGAYWVQLRERLSNSVHDDRDAVVFIHGYNVSFEHAALRAAQIGFDLQVRGAMAFYSWASRGELAAYAVDEAAIELDEAPIADFLCNMALRSGAHKVHVIAHSMGNRAVLRAMDRISLQAEKRSGVRFGQIILAAADLDARKFLELCAAYRALSERTTLYISTLDVAVEASRWLHDFPRAGLMPPVTIAPGIDTVNVTNTDLTLMGHGYVAEAREMLSDIHALIRHGLAPPNRFGLRAVRTPEGAPYWLIGA